MKIILHRMQEFINQGHSFTYSKHMALKSEKIQKLDEKLIVLDPDYQKLKEAFMQVYKQNKRWVKE